MNFKTGGLVFGALPPLKKISYVVWFSLLPFGIDTIHYLTFRYDFPAVFGLPAAGLFVIALAPLILVSLSGAQKLQFIPDIVSLIFVLLIGQIVALWLSGHSSDLGFYSAILALVLCTIVLLPPDREAIAMAVDVFAFVLFLLIALSLALLLLVPEQMTSWHLIRHPWTHIFSVQLWRTHGLFRGVGVFGLYSCLLICLACVSRRRLAVPFSLVGAAGLVASDSRASIVALGACSLILVINYIYIHRARWLMPMGAKIAALALVASAAYFFFWGFDAFLSGSSHRIGIWREALRIGTVARGEILPAEFSHPHNFILAALDQPLLIVSGMLIGATVLVFVLVVRALRRGNVFPMVLMIPIIVFSSFEFGIHWSRLNLSTMALVLGLLFLRYDWETNMVEGQMRQAPYDE